MRIIDADAVKKQAITLVTGTRTWEVVTVSDLDNALTVDTYTEEDVQYAIKEGHQVGYEMAKAKFERPQGHWFLLDECSNEGVYCSNCRKKVYRVEYANQKVKSNFCPNCGADMRGGRE